VDSGEAHLKFELLEEIDAAVGHTERAVERSLRALSDYDAQASETGGGSAEARAALLDDAVEAVWRLIVQHEACNLTNHQQLVERYRIPAEVMARIGAYHRL
jgi:hypothetical protein